jgi:hypothetical protein
VTDARGRRGNGARKRIETAPDYRKKSFAGACQFKGTRATTKERLTAHVLKYPNLVADRGRRDAEFLGRLAEAHVPCGSLEGAQRSQRRKLSHSQE